LAGETHSGVVRALGEQCFEVVDHGHVQFSFMPLMPLVCADLFLYIDSETLSLRYRWVRSMPTSRRFADMRRQV